MINIVSCCLRDNYLGTGKLSLQEREGTVNEYDVLWPAGPGVGQLHLNHIRQIRKENRNKTHCFDLYPASYVPRKSDVVWNILSNSRCGLGVGVCQVGLTEDRAGKLDFLQIFNLLVLIFLVFGFLLFKKMELDLETGGH